MSIKEMILQSNTETIEVEFSEGKFSDTFCNWNEDFDYKVVLIDFRSENKYRFKLFTVEEHEAVVERLSDNTPTARMALRYYFNNVHYVEDFLEFESCVEWALRERQGIKQENLHFKLYIENEHLTLELVGDV